MWQTCPAISATPTGPRLRVHRMFTNSGELTQKFIFLWAVSIIAEFRRSNGDPVFTALLYSDVAHVRASKSQHSSRGVSRGAVRKKVGANQRRRLFGGLLQTGPNVKGAPRSFVRQTDIARATNGPDLGHGWTTKQNANLFGLAFATVLRRVLLSYSVVARAGFEPATFGL